MTISNSIFGSTFYTLTGTHGTHVAIGVFLLGLMYVRSFKPAHGIFTTSEFFINLIHVVAITAAMAIAFIALIPGMLDVIDGGATLATFFSDHAKPLIGEAVACAVLAWFARTAGPSEFGEKNAIDVEAIGLYWHFVDIVWIIIFTAVYLLEYL
jgi:cytochrome o ubiquinol oxidase subunit 3